MKYILLSEKPWHATLFRDVQLRVPAEWLFLRTKKEFNLQNINSFGPDKIFIPHWSYLIPSEIYEAYECIVFHMTDLPFGRGGSPLQNLIVRGHAETKITALRAERGLDTGNIYLKKSLLLYGTAKEIFLRSSAQITEMIVEIHERSVIPVEQTGEVVVFNRRTPEQSNLNGIADIQKVYDHIRMLDCEGYPAAFIETEHFKFEFTRASFEDSQTLLADVRIIKK